MLVAAILEYFSSLLAQGAYLPNSQSATILGPPRQAASHVETKALPPVCSGPSLTR